MQNRESFRVIELKKNRFDGDLGRSALGFNKDFKQYFELSLEDVHKLNMKQTTIKEILSKRKDRESKPKRRQADKDILLEESEDNKNVILDSKEPNFFNKEQQ